MGCFGSKDRLSKEDMDFLKSHTRYDETTIKEWYKGFKVIASAVYLIIIIIIRFYRQHEQKNVFLRLKSTKSGERGKVLPAFVDRSIVVGAIKVFQFSLPPFSVEVNIIKHHKTLTTNLFTLINKSKDVLKFSTFYFSFT